jgi:hypothetical protein
MLRSEYCSSDGMRGGCSPVNVLLCHIQDNVDDLALLRSWLPVVFVKGHSKIRGTRGSSLHAEIVSSRV